MSKSAYMVIDWGSTNVRAFGLVDEQMVYTKKSNRGITSVQGANCAQVFEEVTHDFFAQYGAVPVTMAGMVGSVNGWSEAPYLECPVALSSIGSNLHQVDYSSPVHIVRGLCVKSDNNYNVMRGEETQLLGAIELMQKQGLEVPLCVMPGTHSKWVHVVDGVVKDFRTAMPGELLSVLLEHSLLGMPRSAHDELAPEVFEQGLERGLNESFLMARLFESRGAVLLGGLKREHVKEYLSGLLIGSELKCMLELLNTKIEQVVLIANGMLNERYAKGFSKVGIKSISLDGEQAFLAGICQLAVK